MRPTQLHVGGVLRWTINTRNPDTMLLKDADATPTVTVRKNGSAVGDSVTVTKRSATTGIYDCEYNPAGEVEGDQYQFRESAQVTGTTTAQATYEFSWPITVVAVMRGTDGANTTTPPTASANATAVRSELATELARVDAAVSSRSTLTAQQVWEYATRTLTAISDSSGITTLLSRILGTLAAGTHEPQSGDSFARLGEPAGASIAADIAAIEGGGGSLTGDYTLTVTVTDAADDEPIEGATVTLFRSGERGVQATDADGEAVFGVDAATWTYIVRKGGYSDKTGTRVVSGNGTLAVEMDAIVITPPTAAGTTTLSVLCLDKVGEPEQDVEIQLKMVGVPTGSTGNAFDGKTQTGTSGADGIVELTAIKLARYQYRRGNGSWIAVTLGTGDTQQVVSTIGVDE